MGFTKNLEAVADTNDEPALFRMGDHGLHNGREARDSARSQIVAIGEPARQDYAVISLQRFLLVPHVLHRLAKHVLYGEIGILVAVGAGEADHGKLHFTTSKR